MQVDYLTTDRLSLQPATTEEEAAFMNELLMQSRDLTPTARTPQSAEAMYEEAIADDETYPFLVSVDAADDGPVRIGWVALIETQFPRNFDSAMFILPEYQNEGYGIEAGERMIQYAFDRLGVARLTAWFLETNMPSRKLIEALGFLEEGRTRDATLVDGERIDCVRYGMTRADYEG